MKTKEFVVFTDGRVVYRASSASVAFSVKNDLLARDANRSIVVAEVVTEMTVLYPSDSEKESVEPVCDVCEKACDD